MTKLVSRPGASILALVAAAALGGCGNYSNEDLEFMNALPEREDVAVQAIQGRALPPPALPDNSEAARLAIAITTVTNVTADAFLGLVDAVRSYYPTSRKPNQRIWGPFPAEKHPGWQVQFVMTRDASLTPPRFDYALYMLPPGGGLAITIIAGDFQSTGLAREGSGRLVFTLDDARAAGVQFRDLERLRTLAIDYDKRGWPRRMHVEIYNLPPETPMQALSAIYDYARQENGDTAMSLTLTQDLFPEGPLGLETVTIDNRWVATGEGRATATYTAGDAAGATGTECWNQDLVEIYFSATWDPFSPRGDEMACIP